MWSYRQDRYHPGQSSIWSLSDDRSQGYISVVHEEVSFCSDGYSPYHVSDLV